MGEDSVADALLNCRIRRLQKKWEGQKTTFLQQLMSGGRVCDAVAGLKGPLLLDQLRTARLCGLETLVLHYNSSFVGRVCSLNPC